MVLSMLKTLVFENSDKKSLMSLEKCKNERETRLGKQRQPLTETKKTIFSFWTNETNTLQMPL